MSTLRFLKIWLMALFKGSIRYVRPPTSELPDYRLSPLNHDRFIVDLLKWVNRNRYLLALINTKHRHALHVCLTRNAVMVNVYRTVTSDVFVACSRLMTYPIGGDFNFVQCEWKNGMGANYAPYMQPIRTDADTLEVEPKPLFTFRAPLSQEWKNILDVNNQPLIEPE